MRRLITQSAVGGVCCVCLCGDGQTDRLPPLPPPSMTLTEEVREIIRPECGSCHTSTLTSAKPGAVKVFDLVKADWPGAMSSQQLEKFKRRLARLDDLDRGKVEEFVTREQQKRSSSPIK